jgi:hypothetical protein
LDEVILGDLLTKHATIWTNHISFPVSPVASPALQTSTICRYVTPNSFRSNDFFQRAPFTGASFSSSIPDDILLSLDRVCRPWSQPLEFLITPGILSLDMPATLYSPREDRITSSLTCAVFQARQPNCAHPNFNERHR